MTAVAVVTALVVTVNVAVVAPAATVTLAGVLEDELSSDNVTTAPPAGAALLRVTVPVEELPPFTLVGLMARLESTGALIVRVAVCVVPARVAETVTVVFVPTATVVTVKVAVVAPAATVTLAGVVADGLLSDRVTTVPPVGAAPVRVTVPVEELPPVKVLGLMVTLESTPGLIVRMAFWVPLNVPVIVAEVTLPTAAVFTENVAVVPPPGTVTLAGTVAAALVLDSDTTAPPAGAALLSVTLPVEAFPPIRLAGLRVRLESTGGLMVSVAVCVPL